MLRRLIPSRKRIALYLGILIALCLGKVVWVACFLVDARDLIEGRAREDILTRRAYLVDRVYDEKVGVRAMPFYIGELFQGEWAVGTYSMTAIALANVAFLYPETRGEAARVIESMIERVMSPEIRRFDKNQWWGKDPLETLESKDARLDRGHIGYLGHLNMMLAADAYLSSEGRYRPLFRKVSAALARRLAVSPIHHLETYPGEVYTMDNCVVVASLALFDRRFPEAATGLYRRWLDHCDRKLRDSETGLFPFSIRPDGRAGHTCRGSGAAWNCFFLYYADPAFAAAQFARLREHMVERLPLGVMGIREFPRGRPGHGDVDSGPVIFGLSTSGTGFAMAGARYTGDEELLSGILFTAEVAGFSWQWRGRRRFLLAPLVGDAIMLAMKTITPWDLRYVKRAATP